MSLEDCKGSAYAFRALMKLAADDCARENGEIKPATRLWKTSHPRKVLIGRFAARILRMKARKEA